MNISYHIGANSFLMDAAWFDNVRSAALIARNAPDNRDAVNQFLSALMNECEQILQRAEGYGPLPRIKQEPSQ